MPESIAKQNSVCVGHAPLADATDMHFEHEHVFEPRRRLKIAFGRDTRPADLGVATFADDT